MSLQDQLDERRRQARQEAAVRAAYDQFLQHLETAQAAAQALRPGDAMPAFLLPNTGGQLVDSAGLLARGPLVVTFFRGAWCPYCSLMLDALKAALPEIDAAGGLLVALTPETGGRAEAMKRDHALPYEVLVDVDLAVAMAFGIVFSTPPLYRGLLVQAGIDLAERNGNPAWFLPVPATFVVGGDGVIQRAWVGLDFTRRADPAEIVAALQELREPGPPSPAPG